MTFFTSQRELKSNCNEMGDEQRPNISAAMA